ncbi:MAG: hypothetical protein SRB2_03663 [Desulfobacteraceae bacterium Eth-SRB2]|nr:MAG: hypothetical protein SRB2_03663 [Desulfobacteraceae bacterium Eth-SRB2]
MRINHCCDSPSGVAAASAAIADECHLALHCHGNLCKTGLLTLFQPCMPSRCDLPGEIPARIIKSYMVERPGISLEGLKIAKRFPDAWPNGGTGRVRRLWLTLMSDFARGTQSKISVWSPWTMLFANQGAKIWVFLRRRCRRNCHSHTCIPRKAEMDSAIGISSRHKR